MEMTVLKTISIWILIIFLIAFILIPLIDFLVTQIEIAWMRHKMRKNLKQVVNSSMGEIQKELDDMVDDVIDSMFEFDSEKEKE